MSFEGKKADRIKNLPHYLFDAVDKSKKKAIEKGVDVIDLGIGDPVEPTPRHIIDRLCETAYDKVNHRYPPYTGMINFKASVANWYKRKTEIELDPESQVITLIGAKEGIGHLPFAFVNPGEITLVPDPAYPVYRNGTILAGGKPVEMPLLEENGFLPDLREIDSEVADKAKLLFLNYPNNPTGATATVEFFKEAVDFARSHDIILAHDGAYSEIVFDGYRAPSFLEAEGALDVGIEFHSLSKTYNMTGWRLGYAVGNPDVIRGLGSVKTNLDSGVFQAIQLAGITALEENQECVYKQLQIYQKRRDMLLEALKAMGLEVRPPKATCYVWSHVPDGFNSVDFTSKLIDEIGVVSTPGAGFGKHGEGYVRFSLTVETERLKEATKRMKEVSFK